jgi:predicted RNA binding protein YcfA (HicA-like mRNA interferase family)
MRPRFKAVHEKPQIVIAKKKRIKMGDHCEKYGFKVAHAKGSNYNNKKRKIKILTTVY